ncbi:hypothetical protein HID58_049264, partial [Brassica napus]
MVSPRTVAIVDPGKQRDVSRGCGRRRRQTVTVGESKGKNEFIYGLIKRHDPERAVLSLRLHPHDQYDNTIVFALFELDKALQSLACYSGERVRKEPTAEPSSEHERVEMSRALRDVTTL